MSESIFQSFLLNASNESLVSTNTSRRSRASKLSPDPWRIDPPSHRHAAPSVPWPWVDISSDVDTDQLETKEQPIPDTCEHEGSNCSCWRNYPSSRFPNWTPEQVRKAGITAAIDGDDYTGICTIYRCDVDIDGLFKDPGSRTTEGQTDDDMWKETLRENGDGLPGNLRVRALFVDNMSGPVLQMLGARFNIEPFFFSSSLKWIPSRFQEEIVNDVGDHITVTVPFIKSIDIHISNERKRQRGALPGAGKSQDTLALTTGRIDTQEPLDLNSVKKSLVLDLLSFHLLRNIAGSTLISFHPSKGAIATCRFAPALPHWRSRIILGQSIYWQGMFQRSPDPTLVLVCLLWHAIYAWDEALELLSYHVLSVEGYGIKSHLSELCNVRANYLWYLTLLKELTSTVDFIRESENPFMTHANFPPDVIEDNKGLIAKECKNLNQNVQRLKDELQQQDLRITNVIKLVFSSVTIQDGQHMRRMTEAAVRDSAAMKQIAYLTMIFLPANFVATLFGMNVIEISPETYGTIPKYVASAVPLTVITVGIFAALKSRDIHKQLGEEATMKVSFLYHLAWPAIVVWQHFFKRSKEPSDSMV